MGIARIVAPPAFLWPPHGIRTVLSSLPP